MVGGGGAVLPADRPAGGGVDRERRQTDGVGCARARGPCWLLIFHRVSLHHSHLWLLGHSLTAGLWVKWVWGHCLQWDKLAGMTTAASPYREAPEF